MEEELVSINLLRKQIKAFKSFSFFNPSLKKQLREMETQLEYIVNQILTKAIWECEKKQYNELLDFGCIYKNQKESIFAVPWRENGEWILMPWDVCGLYK